MSKPLDGIRVLDLSRLLPGPYGTLILADLGAEVYKIEDPTTGGDYIRHMPPHVGPYSAYYAALNRGKKSVALNLKDPRGVAAFKRLAATADVVVESFRPGVMDRLGIGWEVLHALNPRLVYCAISGYGQAGPLKDRAGHDLNYIGLSGVLGVSGQAGERPQFPGAQIADIGGGALFGMLGVLAALIERERTGIGRFVDTSMAHGSLAFITMHLVAHYVAGGRAPGPGDLHLGGAYTCYNVYRCKDGRWVTLGALEPKFWENLCTAIGRDDLRGEGLTPPSNDNRTYTEIVREFAARTRDEWLALNAQYDFCCEPILDFDEVRAHPQFAASFFEINGPNGEKIPQVAVPLGLDGCDARTATAPPTLGADTVRCLRDAGFSDQEIEELKNAGVAL